MGGVNTDRAGVYKSCVYKPCVYKNGLIYLFLHSLPLLLCHRELGVWELPFRTSFPAPLHEAWLHFTRRVSQFGFTGWDSEMGTGRRVEGGDWAPPLLSEISSLY